MNEQKIAPESCGEQSAMEGGKMKIVNCKVNHLKNPVGFNMESVRISWAVEDSISKRQRSARVILSSDIFFEQVLLDTGKQQDIDNRGFELTIELLPYTRYYWKVEVEGEADSGVSEINYFETGRMNEKWEAKWIKPPWRDENTHPYFRKEFLLNKKIRLARAYVTGLGLYELEINGQRVGNERMTPYCNAYDAWVQYQTYDITEFLSRGQNVVGAMMGNGWAKGPFGSFGSLNAPYINNFFFLCELHIVYDDGSCIHICSDNTWRCYPAPVITDSIYDGEIYDAQMEVEGWSCVGLEDALWEDAVVCDPKGIGSVVDRLSVPVIIKEERKPLAIIKTPKGETVVDMGQNMVGWLRVKVQEPCGTEIKISYGELLQDGNFYRDNLRSAKQEYIYISNGKASVIEPHFSFYGFRFAKLEGFSKPVSCDELTGCVVYSDLDTTGDIETSDPVVNRLFQNALWGQKGNFLDFPTDCPQRDERLGWTGDAQVFSGTASFNMDTYAFYIKYMKDLYEEQKFSDGMVASTVPTFFRVKHKVSSSCGGGSSAWSDAATIIPWVLYIQTGDITILKRQYQSMKDYVDWIIKQDRASGNRRLWTVGFHFGDWLALDGPVEGGVEGGTDKSFIASAYYRLSALIVSKAAQVLGISEDYEFYGSLSQEIKKAIQQEFFGNDGLLAIPTQTAYVIALQFDLVEKDMKERFVDELKALLLERDMHLSTGFVGTPYLCRVLSDYGESDSAYEIFFQKDYPGWLYAVLMGATTIWERWNSVLPNGRISGTDMNSMNHYAYGSIVEWMYRNMCGIQPIEEGPGFKKFLVSPNLNGRLVYAKAQYLSAMGKIESSWKITGERFVCIEVTVPFDAEAILILPNAQLETVNGIVGEMTGEQEDDKVKIKLSAGSYRFNYESTKRYVIQGDGVYSEKLKEASV